MIKYKKQLALIGILLLFIGGCTTSGIHLFSVQLIGTVIENSPLKQPISGVEIRTTSGQVLGHTDADGSFTIETEAHEGQVIIELVHSDYQTKEVLVGINGHYDQTIEIAPQELKPAQGQIQGRVSRQIVIPEIESVDEESLHKIEPATGTNNLQTQQIQGEYNLLVRDSREWLEKLLHNRAEIIYDGGDGFYTIQLEDEVDEDLLLEELTQKIEIEFITPNRTIYPMAIEVRDSLWNELWNLQMLDLDTAWEYSKGEGVTVAVLDTLYTSAHPDLADNLLPAQNTSAYTEEDLFLNLHGLHVAGIIGAVKNDFGVVGVAPKVQILPIRVFDVAENSTVSDIAQAIDLAIEAGAQVINMSFGTYDIYNPSNDFPDLHYSITKAYQAGITLVASAGNRGTGYILYPAAYPEVIAVGAVDAQSGRANYSQYGTGLEVVAPGGDGPLAILSTGWDKGSGEYTYLLGSGTSMAAPHVSGIVALMIANGISDPDYIRQVLRETAIDLGEEGYDPEYGYGLVDPLTVLDRFQHTYVFFGDVDLSAGHAIVRSVVSRVEVNGTYQLTGVRAGMGKVIAWMDINANLRIDPGDYLGYSGEIEIRSDQNLLTDMDIQVERIEGDFSAIAIGSERLE